MSQGKEQSTQDSAPGIAKALPDSGKDEATEKVLINEGGFDEGKKSKKSKAFTPKFIV